MTAKRCPVCSNGMLGFVAQPTIRDDETIRVMATCTDCRYVFFHHFFFEEMLTEIYVIEDDDADEKEKKNKRSVQKTAIRKPNHLKLVKPGDTFSSTPPSVSG